MHSFSWKHWILGHKAALDKEDIEIFKENFRKYYASSFGTSLSEKSYKDHPYFMLKL